MKIKYRKRTPNQHASFLHEIKDIGLTFPDIEAEKIYNYLGTCTGGDIGVTGGTVPQNVRWRRPMHPSPKIFREVGL